MAFKATPARSGALVVHGIEAFIERKLAELRRSLQGLGKKGKAKKKGPARAARASKPTGEDPLARLLAQVSAHPKRAALVKAGKQKDQLLRSLIPLYVSRGAYEITSGTTSKFWAKHGVTYAAPNAAKALREHVGYARRTAKGLQITPNGVKYVEAALGQRRAA